MQQMNTQRPGCTVIVLRANFSVMFSHLVTHMLYIAHKIH